MAYKTNAPFGLQPRFMLDGSPWNGGLQEKPIASAYATSLFTGDPVTLLDDGTIGIGVAGSAIVGVFMGCKYTDSDGMFQHRAYWPAGTTVQTGSTPFAHVIVDPNVVYSIQEDDDAGAAGTALALADRNLNANFSLNTAGSTVTGQSGATLDNTSEDTTATLNLKILDLDRGNPENETVGDFANWLVLINNHQLKGSTGTAGV